MAGQGNMPPDEEKFIFSESLFSGKKFYDKYRNAVFLQKWKNVRKILTQIPDIYRCYENVKLGGSLAIEGMFLAPNVPLVLKKTNNPLDLVNESEIAQDDFTFRRLIGLVAAYAYSKQVRNIYSDLAEYIVCNRNNYRVYLSALPGTEYFVDQFGYMPFLCALRKYQLKITSMPEERLLAVAYIQDNTMIPNILRCARSFKYAEFTAREVIGFDLKKAIETAPEMIKEIFIKHPTTQKLFKTVCKPE